MAHPSPPAAPQQAMGSTNTVFITETRFDPSYVKTLPGMIKIAVIFFGYLAMVLYGFDAFLKHRAWRSGELAQGNRVPAKQMHVVTPPSLP